MSKLNNFFEIKDFVVYPELLIFKAKQGFHMC